MDRIHVKVILTTEFIPAVLHTDGINRTGIMTSKFIPLLLTDREEMTDILTNQPFINVDR